LSLPIRNRFGVAKALVLLIALAGLPAGAGCDAPPPSWTDRVNLETGGFVRAELHIPCLAGDDAPGAFGRQAAHLLGTADLKAKAAFGEQATGLVNLRGRTDPMGKDIVPASLVGQDADAAVDLREGYLRWRGERLDLTLGKQIIAWGVADGINPTDRLCPQNQTIVSSDPDDRRMGIPALRADLYLDAVTLTGIWQPFFEDSKLRLSRLPQGAEVLVDEVDLPARTLSNSIGAVKCAVDPGGATSFSVSYYNGWDSFPDIILNQAVTSDEGTSVRVTPVFNRIRNLGLDFSHVWGEVILRGEAAYTHVVNRGRRSPGRRKSTFQWIVGPEWEGFEKFTVNLQYGMTHVIDFRTVPGDDEALGDDPQAGIDAFNVSMNRQMNRTTPVATLRLDYRLLHDTLLLQFRGLYYTRDEEVRLRPQIAYDINDRLKATLAAYLCFGPAGSRFHRYGENYNEVFTELKYSF